MSSSTQIVVCGSIAVDRIFSFEGSFDDKIDTNKLDVLSVSILMDRYDIVDGGIGPNITYNIAQLGLEPILVGSVGEDSKGYMEKLRGFGVNTSFVNISTLPTATFTVLGDKNGNQVAGFYPGAMSDSDSLSLKPWYDKDALICISAHDPSTMKRHVAECAAHGLRLLYDPGQQVNNVSGEDLLEGCKAAEIIIVNEYELEILAKKTQLSDTELKALPKIFITTKGKAGSVIEGSSMDTPMKVGIASPKQVVDPTGAGDAYRAGLMYGIVHGWDIKESAQLGAVVGSFNVEVSGQVQNYSPADLKSRYEEAFGTTIKLNSRRTTSGRRL